MAISRAQLAKELEPGLNSLFGLSYDEYTQEYAEIFSTEDSQRLKLKVVLLISIKRRKVTQAATRTTQLRWLLQLPKRL